MQISPPLESLKDSAQVKNKIAPFEIKLTDSCEFKYDKRECSKSELNRKIHKEKP